MTKDPNAEYYRRISDLNAVHYAAEIPYYSNAPVRDVEQAIIRRLTKGSRVMDAACGSGRLSIPLAQAGFDVTGVDCTAACIDAASHRSHSLNLGNIRFIISDLSDLKLPSSSYDYVICPRFSINAISTFQRRKQAIAEMLRVVKPGGMIYVESFNYFYLGRGPLNVTSHLLRDGIRYLSIILCKLRHRPYTGLLPGDILYTSNKTPGAPDGYAHLATPLELARLVPPHTRYCFRSIPQILCKADRLRWFRYSIWLIIAKGNDNFQSGSGDDSDHRKT